ncbi:MAG: ABC transporter substrate-binding protein [Hydrogenophaga sp.]|jgi:NitT/TauT family transport system substrate-binding protein|uniref:ABC transporter substrate-binding protein n=1 Tax=Hydrogenophaga sp. TaxID=1904254 RepID=UPI001DD95A9C|nr:ABC transporter substrate-binding protein [Hydrogenophaga sp.]MBW0171159.1 ABC transporter substrate-binding protein [Hydrogenophaga sp.]MBW0184592.1 ABC transporter substrate-binding protein [Hydrogenophaga sp.]
MMKRRTALAALTAVPAVAGLPAAFAQGNTKIVFGYTAVTDFASVFVAAENGYFKKRGLDVELKFIPINSTIPAAVQADSLQIGGPTPSVYLQSVDGGLDHVVVAGAGVTSKTITGFGLVAKAGSGIRTAKDCVGKKIGVPGLGAFLHVTFRAWLKSQGVDYKAVNFVEASFPQHGDLLRGGSVDAVVSADPFMSRITDSGVGYVASYYSTFLPENQPTIIHVAKRDWVAKNPAAAKGFREAVQEAATFMNQPKNDGAVRAAIGKYIKLPPEVIAKVQISPPGPVVTEKQLNYWVGLMKDQEMLKSTPDVARLIAK